MKCCMFCTQEAQILFNHMAHDIGSLCIECYMKLHGSCGVCNVSFLPAETKPDVNYQVQAKFIKAGEKTFMVCDHCYEAIHQEFPQMFA